MDQTRANRCQDVASGDRFALVLAAQVDPGRRGELIEEFRPLIATVARPYCRHGSIERNELMQQGVVGLLEALKRYDPSLGTPFWAYASWWVRQAMQQVTSELDGPIVLSDRARRSLSRLAAARRAYLQEQRREPTRRELAAAAELDVGHVESLLAANSPARALEERIGDGDDGLCLGDQLADPRADDEFERISRGAAPKGVPALLALLSDRERLVVSRHFGLNGKARTLRDIAGDLGVSAERVRQIEERALQTLRTAWPATGELEFAAALEARSA
jgi:RNA polymerase sigma factor (sigma-70 family)